MPLDGPYRYCTINCKGAASQMILLGGPEPTPAQPFTLTSYIRQLVARELVDNTIHVLYAHTFSRRLASEVGALKQSLYSTSIEIVLVYIRSM